MEQESSNREESIKEPYSSDKLNALRRILEARARSGNPYYFKIQVSGIVVVEKTTDLTKFDSYEELLPAATEITIWLFTNERTPNYYMKKVYTVQHGREQTETRMPQPTLDGAAIMRETELLMKVDRLQGRLDQKEEKIKDMQEKLSESEEYLDKQDERIEQLKKEVETLKAKRGMEDRSLGEILMGGAEGLLRRNPHWFAKFKGGETIAGIIEMDNQEKETFSSTSAEESTASFSKKKPAEENEEEKEFLSAMKWVRGHFEEKEFEKVMKIVGHFSKHKEDIATVNELLNIKEEE